MPRSRRRRKGATEGGVSTPPSKKEKAVQVRRILDASFEGDKDAVLEVLSAWQSLALPTQQRYLQSKDLDGETAYQMAKRAYQLATTNERHRNPTRAASCSAIAKLLLCAEHMNIKAALNIHKWELKEGERFEGEAPFIKGESLPLINVPVSTQKGRRLKWTKLHTSVAAGDVAAVVKALQHGANPLQIDVKGRTARDIALFEAQFESNLDEDSKRFEMQKDQRSLQKLPSIIDEESEGEDDSNTNDEKELDAKAKSSSLARSDTLIRSKPSPLMRRNSSIATDAPTHASGIFISHLLLASSWLSVDEVTSEMEAAKRKRLTKKRLDAALKAAHQARERESLWKKEACGMWRPLDKGDGSSSGNNGVWGESWTRGARKWATGVIRWGEKVKELFAGVSTSVRLDEVNLARRRVKIDVLPKNSMGPLARAIAVNTYITELNLSKMKLTDNDASMLAPALTYNHKLERLLLNDNLISDEGARALSYGLTFHVQDYIRYIDLTSNQISDRGALCLLYFSWTHRAQLEDHMMLKPSVLVPIESIDLVTLLLLDNPISDITKTRLGKRREAIFVVRTPGEKVALFVQKRVRTFLAKRRTQRRLNAMATIKKFIHRRASQSKF